MPKKVLVILETRMRPGRAQLIGILRRINEARLDWDLEIIPSRSAMSETVLARASRNGVDGVIIAVPGGLGVPDHLARARHPVVFMDVLEPQVRFNPKTKLFLHVDDSAISRIAAQHFLELGNFRSFAFVHDPRGEIWTQVRGIAFAEALKKHKRSCAVHTPASARRTGSRRRLADFLLSLPQPAAVMAACDAVAADVIDACQAARLAVPEAVAVLGVDNDEALCERRRPHLSSVEPDFEDEGFRAAGALAGLLGTPVGDKPDPEPTLRITERESTRPLPPSTRLVERALAFIEANYTRPISVRDVIRHLGVSRRLADLRFHQLENESILEAITKRRLVRLSQLLRESNAPINRLARDCGFGSATRAAHLFKRRTGVSMTSYRQAGKAQTLILKHGAPAGPAWSRCGS